MLTCPPPEAGTGGIDAGGPDGGSDAGGTLPPTSLCHTGPCFPLTDAIRSNLVLLLWPSNLPAIGSKISVWADQSGQGNDARALATLPQVTSNGVQLASDPGSGFWVLDSPSLDLAAGDFTVIVVAGLISNPLNSTFFEKADGARTNSRKVALWWTLSSPSAGGPEGFVDDTQLVSPIDTPQPSIGIYALRRTADHVELSLNGTTLASADLPAGTSTTNSDDVYIGVADTVTTPVDSVEAVIVLRGATATDDLNGLESFLAAQFSM